MHGQEPAKRNAAEEGIAISAPSGPGRGTEDTLIDGELIVVDVNAPPQRPRARSLAIRRIAPFAAGGILVLITAAVAAGWGGPTGQGPVGERSGPGTAVEDGTPGSSGPAAEHGATDAGPQDPRPSGSTDRATPPASPGASGSAEPGTGGATPSDPEAPATSPGGGTPSSGTRPPTTPAGPAVLRKGDQGAGVSEMQHRLHNAGFYHGYRYSLFDQDTFDALRRFQLWSAVAPEVTSDPAGVYGHATRKALERIAVP